VRLEIARQETLRQEAVKEAEASKAREEASKVAADVERKRV